MLFSICAGKKLILFVDLISMHYEVYYAEYKSVLNVVTRMVQLPCFEVIAIAFAIIYNLAYLKSCRCQLIINVKNQGGDIVQESISSNITDDTITLEFQRPEGTLITQFIDFKSVNRNLYLT